MGIHIKFVLFERTFKMIYKLPLQLFHILFVFEINRLILIKKQRAFRHLRYYYYFY
jgi:hypothetical protein